MMHTREPSCDHDWGNSETSEGSRPKLTLTCMTGSDRIYACCIQNNNNNMLGKKMHMYASVCAFVNICVHGLCRDFFLFVCLFLDDWLCVSVCERFFFSLLYGQCRSINNARLAEVKKACVWWKSRGGGRGKETMGDKENEEMGKCRAESGDKQAGRSVEG